MLDVAVCVKGEGTVAEGVASTRRTGDIFWVSEDILRVSQT